MSSEATDPLDTVFNRLAAGASADYVGEPVSQLEHALQCAALAERAGCSDVEVLAALCHDIGHLEAPASAARMDDLGVLDHDTRGAEFLAAHGAPADLCELVSGHVSAKRYLVANNARYAAALSLASRATLVFQGGAMTPDECAAFDAHPLRDALLRLRRFDEAAKVPGAQVPDLESHRDRARRVFVFR